MDYLDLIILAGMFKTAAKRSFLGFLPFLFFVFQSCQSTYHPLGIEDLSQKGWHQDSVLSFPLLVEKEKPASFDLLYQLKVSDKYPYQNIWLKYKIFGPTGQLITESKDNLFLFDPKTGKSLATSAMGITYATAYFLKDVRFPTSGKYTIQVQHYMRKERVFGIENLAVLAQSK